MGVELQEKIANRLRRMGRGKVFTPKDFLEIGSRDAIDQALSRLTKSKTIQRVGRGLYCYPRINKRLRIAVPPDVDEIADALARQTGSRIAPSGATAANRLGLSTQVPAKPVYLSDGRSRKVRVGNFVIVIKHVPPKELPLGHRTSATVLQALRYVGKDAINSTVIRRIRKALSRQSRSQLFRDSHYTTGWIAEAVQKIIGPDEDTANHG